ncbi:hypothetical protein ONZ43_g729 [Nemania bipapillata]|uniref:Uncharacterized protein n=1 Tax=Nemania bipapillata TaxID=110536 RepID=A0ACC2J795_9PEZI|nr:hypothetical protein ONZ43_g729 [Nemania bipapillata]
MSHSPPGFADPKASAFQDVATSAYAGSSEYGTFNASGCDDVDGPDANNDLVTVVEDRDLKRGLAQRHLSMLGIAGAIGTGLFLGLGSAVQTAGPLGASR